MLNRIIIWALCCPFLNVYAATCSTDAELKALDTRYEQALRQGDSEFLAGLLAAEFIWVHNQASDIEDRTELLTRMNPLVDPPQSRTTRDLSIHRQGNTAVIAGISQVERAAEHGSVRMDYRFMRTYVSDSEGCQLLAVQTMKVWTSEEGKSQP